MFLLHVSCERDKLRYVYDEERRFHVSSLPISAQLSSLIVVTSDR